MKNRSLRAWLSVGVASVVLAAGIAVVERRVSRVASNYPQDTTQLRALLVARSELERNVLEARAGLQLNFDPIHHAVLVLRTATQEARLLRTRGAVYAQTAAALTQLSEALKAEEPALENFKTDLALLRLASRYFPLAADALTQRATCAGDKHPAAHGGAAIAELRTYVERYEDQPTPEIARRLEAALAELDAVLGALQADDPERADMKVLLGHTRAILSRRERLDRFARTLARAPAHRHVEAAVRAYEHAARGQLVQLTVLRSLFGVLVTLGLVALGFAVKHTTRR